MIFKIKCNIEAVVDNLNIEADTEEEALEKFYKLDAGDIIKNGLVFDMITSNEKIIKVSK